MSDKRQNIITNILGLLMVGISTYGLVWYELELISFMTLCGIGLALFLFKVNQSKTWLRKLFNKKLDD